VKLTFVGDFLARVCRWHASHPHIVSPTVEERGNMDVGAVPIQVQTPPKEDEPEAAPEPSSDPMDSIEVSDKPDFAQDAGNDEDDDAGEEKRDDEIVVGTNGTGVGEKDGHGSETSLSSALGSDAEPEVAESRTCSCFPAVSCYSRVRHFRRTS